MPKEVRDRHGLGPGSELEIEESGQTIVLRPLEQLPGLVEKEGILVFRGRATADLEAAIRSHRTDRLRKSRGGKA